jgi:PilZ domain
VEARKCTRYAVQLPVSFNGDQLSREGEGTILNLSADGCAITSTTVAGTAAYLQLTMQLREREEPVHVDLAAVRWSTTARFGVEFIKVRPEEGERLKRFVKALESSA